MIRRADLALLRLKRDDFSSNRHPALSFCLSMIFSENRCTLFRIMLWVQNQDIWTTVGIPQKTQHAVSVRRAFNRLQAGLRPLRHSLEIGVSTGREIVMMNKAIFVSLPVTDLKASVAFYESIGFRNNPRFTDETAACMVWSESISFMLLTHAKWRTFTSRPIPPKTSSEVMLALSCDSRDAVDAMNSAAAANGGTADINPIEDHGFMYARDLADPDGHALGAMWMDMSAIPSGDKVG
jgi:uncharacterized protein